MKNLQKPHKEDDLSLEEILESCPDKNILAAYGEAKLARQLLADTRALYEEKLKAFDDAIKANESYMPADHLKVFKDAAFKLFVEP